MTLQLRLGRKRIFVYLESERARWLQPASCRSGKPTTLPKYLRGHFTAEERKDERGGREGKMKRRKGTGKHLREVNFWLRRWWWWWYGALKMQDWKTQDQIALEGGRKMTDHRELDWILTVCAMTVRAKCTARCLRLAPLIFPCLPFSQPQPHLAGMYKVLRLVSEILRVMCPAVWSFYVDLTEWTTCRVVLVCMWNTVASRADVSFSHITLFSKFVIHNT